MDLSFAQGSPMSEEEHDNLSRSTKKVKTSIGEGEYGAATEEQERDLTDNQHKTSYRDVMLGLA